MALEAVRKYKFKPAMKDGRTPVPVMITIEVNFRLYYAGIKQGVILGAERVRAPRSFRF